MSRTTSRLGMALATGVAAVGLAACGGGSDNPKVSDASAFRSKCESKLKSSSTGNSQANEFVKSKASQLCTCIQQKFQAAGLGDKRFNDSAALNNRREGTQCAQEVLIGRSSSGGGGSGGGGYFPGG
ncbi:MAG: hypothetical protein E6G56_05385 [Actinobacteria bacterium]|nr:MAG: hypothetical protein E6G56_05385 [Actinomycetota bacterium]